MLSKKNIPGWQTMRFLGRSRIVSTSYAWLFIVPVAANAMKHTPDQLDLSVLGQTATVVLKLPFSWQMFYMAAVAFSLAGIVFWVQCPRLIRNFGSMAEFQSLSNSKLDILQGYFVLLRERQYLRTNGEAELRQFMATTSYPPDRQDGYVKTLLNPTGGVELDHTVEFVRSSDAFKWVRDQSDRLRFPSLVIAWLLYGLGLAATLWVTIQGAIAVVTIVFR